MNKLDKPMEYCIQLKLPKKTDYSDAWAKIRERLDKVKKAHSNHRLEQEKKYKPEYYWIPITYPLLEERLNIIQWYTRQINQIQEKIDNADADTDWELIRKRAKEVKQLERERLQFKLLNPLTR